MIWSHWTKTSIGRFRGMKKHTICIQNLSKEKGWNKKTFLAFAKALETKDTKKAASLYMKNWKTMSPFLPTCCTFEKVLSVKKTGRGLHTSIPAVALCRASVTGGREYRSVASGIKACYAAVFFFFTGSEALYR